KPSQIAEGVLRLARNDGFQFSNEAEAALKKTCKPGTTDTIAGLWQAIKAAQSQRVAMFFDRLDGARGLNHVIAHDVANACSQGGDMKRDPLAVLDAMAGLKDVKREVRAILAKVKLAAKDRAAGLKSARPRLNLLFAGNPGTGKTTVAELLAEALVDLGYLKSP